MQALLTPKYNKITFTLHTSQLHRTHFTPNIKC